MFRLTATTSLLAVLICSGTVCAADYDLLREGHPRLEMTPAEIEDLRADEDAVENARRAADDFIKRGRTTTYEEYFVTLPEPEFPPEHDDRWPYWTGMAGELRSAMASAARAYVLTDNRKYLGWCRKLMLAVADWRQWTDPWYGTQPCLDTHHLTRGMCVAVDLLWHDLPEEDRATVVEAIAEKGAEFIYEHGNDDASYVSAPGRWPNGYAMINTELGVAGLTLLGEHERADEWLGQALDKTRLFFDEQGGVDGGLVEGFGYGSAAVDNLMYLVRKSDAIVGVNLFEHPYLSEAITFPAYFMVPGGGRLANFGDNGGPQGIGPTLTGLARAMLEVESSPLAAWYLQKAGKMGPKIERLAQQPDLPTAKHFRDIDWVAMRSGWRDTGSLLALKSGYVAHHNHLDQNSFILAYDDEWLLNDPGYQIYDRPYPPERNMTEEMIDARHAYTYGTIGHNAILVDGEGQLPERGHVVGFASTAAMDYTVGDASPCYEGLQRYLRHVISVTPDYYIIFDEIASGGPARTVEVLLHTTPDGEFLVDGSSIPRDEIREAGQCTVRRTGEALARFIEPGQVAIEHRQHPHCENYGHYLSAKVPGVREQTIVWGITAGSAGTAELHTRSVDDSGRAVQVRVGSAMDTIALGGDEATTADELAFTADAAMVRDSRAGVHRYAMVNGTKLQVGEARLLTADVPVTAGAVIDEHVLRATIACDEPTSVTLFSPVEPDMMRLTGLDEPVDVSINEDAGTLTLGLPAGRYELELREL